MPELKSLLMLLAITVVGATATWYIKDQIYNATAVVPEVLPTSMVTITDTPTSTPNSGLNGEITTPQEIPNRPVKPPQSSTPSISVSVSGKLTEVNTGCFSDGECYAMVDGKKVVLLIGWYQGKVGKILGADSIGDLENYIGGSATVFAGQDDNGNYTLLGNESFYIQVSSTTKPVTGGTCVVGGCSAQLCGEAGDMDGMVTTCEYREEYACFKTAKCERQLTGKCGWTDTPELALCLKKAS